MELYSRDCGFLRHIKHAKYRPQAISKALIELLLEDRSDLGNLNVAKVRKTITGGFPLKKQ